MNRREAVQVLLALLTPSSAVAAKPQKTKASATIERQFSQAAVALINPPDMHSKR